MDEWIQGTSALQTQFGRTRAEASTKHDSGNFAKWVVIVLHRLPECNIALRCGRDCLGYDAAGFKTNGEDLPDVLT